MCSTVYITGFPADVTERELENLCRFLPGFVGTSPTFSKGATVWVRFQDPDCAAAAVPLLDEQPFNMRDMSLVMKAVIAKSDTTPRPFDSMASPLEALVGWGSHDSGGYKPGTGGLGSGGVLDNMLQSLVMPGQGGDAGGSFSFNDDYNKPKMPRPVVEPADNDTLVLFGIGDKGLTEQDLLTFFNQIEGFITLQCTNSIGKGGGNCFIKFETAGQAQAAIDVARYSDVVLDVARTSLNVSGGSPTGLSGFGGGGGGGSNPFSAGSWGPPAKKPKIAASSGECDTLVVFQIGNKSVTEEELSYSVFGPMDGFVAIQVSGGNGGGNAFIKFASVEQAQIGLQLAPESLNVQVARTSLNIRPRY